MQGFFHLLQYLLATDSIDIKAANFNYDLLNVSENNFLDIFSIKATVENIYILDNDIRRIVVEQVNVDFHTVS